MELKDIKALIDLMKKNDLSVFKMENEGFKITLKKDSGLKPMLSYAPAPQPMVAASPQSAPATSAPAAAAETPAAVGGKEIVSPMVGTLYLASAPDAQPFVTVGDVVNEETVVCIVEAMKVMNEIKAEMNGTITEVVGVSGKPVQFGQALFRVK